MDESIRPRTPIDAFTQALDIISGDAQARARELEKMRQADAKKLEKAIREQDRVKQLLGDLL